MRRKFLLIPLLLLLALAALFTREVGRAQDLNRAGLVVQFGDGNVVTACVPFVEDAITGADLLRYSGLDVILDPTSSMGEAVCKIDAGGFANGCEFPLEDCFCQCQGNECEYWAYFHLKDGAWEYSQVGAGNWQVRHGDVEGWAWSLSAMNGEVNTEPPVITFEEICGSEGGAAPAPRTPPSAPGAPAAPSPAPESGEGSTPPSGGSAVATASLSELLNLSDAATATAQALRKAARRTPTPTPASPTRPDNTLLYVGGFILLVVVVGALGAWALLRQSR
jgi:hypothetical protein